MLAPTTIKRKAAALTRCDGLRFVLTTLPLTPWKDRDHGFVHPVAAHFKPH